MKEILYLGGGYYETRNEYRKGNFSLPQAIMDTVFGIYSSADSKYGTWTGIWYNLGKEYGPIHKYLKIK